VVVLALPETALAGMMVLMVAWSEEPLDKREFPDDSDLDADVVLGPLVPCPYCGAAIFDGAQQCPLCKQWVSHSLGDWRSSRKWYVRGGRWAVKVLLVNWPIVLGLSVPAILAWFIAGC